MSRYEQMKVSLQNFCADLYNSIICHLDVNLSVITEENIISTYKITCVQILFSF